MRQKRNLFGNWAMGCRKMYGMGAMDDLGIWFMFNVRSHVFLLLFLPPVDHEADPGDVACACICGSCRMSPSNNLDNTHFDSDVSI